MSVKGINFTKDSMAYPLRLQIATFQESYREAARIKSDYIVDVFNDRNIHLKPDKVGITIFYPNSSNPTHMITRSWSLSIGEKEFTKQVIALEEELLTKVNH